MITKALSGVEIKELDDKVHVEAVFATLDTKDHDGDVTQKGAFGKQNVRISDWNHSTWGGSKPIGMGTICEEGKEAVFRGTFFKTQAAQEMREVLKGLGDLSEWSYGFDVDESEPGTHDGEKVRVLKRMTVHEVSPVLKGAGIGTHTRSVKGLDGTLDEQIVSAVEAVEQAIERAERVEALRAEKGMEMTTAVRKSLEGLNAASARLNDLLSKNDIDRGELESLYAKFAILHQEG